MGKEDGIQMGNACPEHLLSEIRAGIYQYLHTFIFDKSAGSQPLVTRIPAAADITTAAYHRHALGCTCA